MRGANTRDWLVFRVLQAKERTDETRRHVSETNHWEAERGGRREGMTITLTAEEVATLLLILRNQSGT
jgi:hypothetical protein